MYLLLHFFAGDADLKIRGKLIDGFDVHDSARLTEVLGSAYVPFSDSELEALAKIPFVIISKEWFMDYAYAMNTESGEKMTEFYNPTTLENNHFLHFWGVFSTSPFENAVCFTTDDIGVTSVTVSPSTATVYKGQSLELSATVATTGFANKAVAWSIDEQAETKKAVINESGKLSIPATYDNTGAGQAGVWTIAIPTILETGDVVKVNGISYTVDASSQDTIAKQITAMKSAYNVASVTDGLTVGGTSTTTTLTEKSGHYGQAKPVFEFIPASGSAGSCTITDTTEGQLPGNTVIVTATSVYDKTKSATSTITVA